MFMLGVAHGLDTAAKALLLVVETGIVTTEQVKTDALQEAYAATKL